MKITLQESIFAVAIADALALAAAVVGALALTSADLQKPAATPAPSSVPAGMAWVPGGKFLMGSDHHEYNFFGLERTNVAGTTALAPGKRTIVYEFIPDAAKPGTGGKSILSVDGNKVAEGQIPKTQPFIFSGDEGVDVGLDGETNVSNDDKPAPANAFTGRIVKIKIDVGGGRQSRGEQGQKAIKPRSSGGSLTSAARGASA